MAVCRSNPLPELAVHALSTAWVLVAAAEQDIAFSNAAASSNTSGAGSMKGAMLDDPCLRLSGARRFALREKARNNGIELPEALCQPLQELAGITGAPA